MTSQTKEVCICSLMNIGDKSSNSKLAPVGMAAAIPSPKDKPAIMLAVPSVRLSVCLSAPTTALPTLPPCPHSQTTRCTQGYRSVMHSLKKITDLSFSCSV